VAERFQPMLAGKADLSKVAYPVMVSPKLDGVRCVVHGDQVLSRKLKPIPNNHIVETLLPMNLEGLDGELMLDLPGSFSQVSSAVMSVDGAPDFTYFVFDRIGQKAPYTERYASLERDIENLAHPCVQLVEHRLVNSEAELLEVEATSLDCGFEGLMIRSLTGPYKYGRSTTKEGYLLKLKRFEDAEAVVVGFEELMHNENEATTNELGLTKRSSAKAGKVAGGTLGKLRCARQVGEMTQQFSIGSGFTEAQRAELWAGRAGLKGLVVKFKFQPNPAAPLEAPRFPVFLGLRSEID
jgi:DNA ligase-1